MRSFIRPARRLTMRIGGRPTHRMDILAHRRSLLPTHRYSQSSNWNGIVKRALTSSSMPSRCTRSSSSRTLMTYAQGTLVLRCIYKKTAIELILRRDGCLRLLLERTAISSSLTPLGAQILRLLRLSMQWKIGLRRTSVGASPTTPMRPGRSAIRSLRIRG